MSPAPRTCTTLIAILAALSLAACDSAGESQDNKALSTICDARADIHDQIDTLKGIRTGETNGDEAQKAVLDIKGDISSITTAADDLSGDKREDMQNANQEFKQSVGKSLQQLSRGNVSGAQASSQIGNATDDLESSYKETLENVDCGD